VGVICLGGVAADPNVPSASGLPGLVWRASSLALALPTISSIISPSAGVQAFLLGVGGGCSLICAVVASTHLGPAALDQSLGWHRIQK
jgi:hypothetical protein